MSKRQPESFVRLSSCLFAKLRTEHLFCCQVPWEQQIPCRSQQGLLRACTQSQKKRNTEATASWLDLSLRLLFATQLRGTRVPV